MTDHCKSLFSGVFLSFCGFAGSWRENDERQTTLVDYALRLRRGLVVLASDSVLGVADKLDEKQDLRLEKQR
jgi:hypothetical protein